MLGSLREAAAEGSGYRLDSLAMMISSSREAEVVAAAEHRTPQSPPRPSTHSRLHNFSFPTLSWGVQRLLRCSAKLPNGATRHHELLHPPVMPPPPPPPPPPLRARKETEDEDSSSSAVAVAARPWNLRTRRAACSAPPPPGEANGRNRNSSLSPSPSPLQTEKKNGASKSVRLRSEGRPEEKGERRRLLVSLSREEIEEDFLLFKGSKPPRRPKKRPRVVQRQLDSLFPGLWLTEVTLDTYKISE